MLALLFKVRESRFAVPARDLLEVLPLIKLDRIVGVPAHFRGICRHRGVSVPVADLSLLLGGPPSAREISTRVFVLAPKPGRPPLGFLAERATETRQFQESEFEAISWSSSAVPFVTRVRQAPEGALHWVDADRLCQELGAGDAVPAEPLRVA